MKNSKKLILMSTLTIVLAISFLIPTSRAVEWTYDGVDTEHIPDFSVFPSERFFYNYTGPSDNPELLGLFEIVKGNISDFGSGNGTCVWGDAGQWNVTSGEIVASFPNALFSFWNETIGYYSAMGPLAVAIPVENDGKVSLPILNNVSAHIASFFTVEEFEHSQVYPSIYSIAFWNTSTTNAFTNYNYTDDGILTKWDSYGIPIGNYTLVSQPAQLPPDISFTTESGNLNVTSTNFNLNITITDADNNNDGVDDTDYEYRIQNGSTWSAWTAPPSQLYWGLGSVASGNYDITIEVKNMYGITSDSITIRYTAPKKGGFDIIPVIIGVIIVCIAAAAAAAVFLILRRRNRERKAGTEELAERKIPPEEPKELEESEKVEDET